MPKSRPPLEVWHNIRRIIWSRDKHQCVHCGRKITLSEAEIDHIVSGKLGTNKFSNLRTLCKVCHATRLDHRHRVVARNALRDGLINADWEPWE